MTSRFWLVSTPFCFFPFYDNDCVITHVHFSLWTATQTKTTLVETYIYHISFIPIFHSQVSVIEIIEWLILFREEPLSEVLRTGSVRHSDEKKRPPIPNFSPSNSTFKFHSFVFFFVSSVVRVLNLFVSWCHSLLLRGRSHFGETTNKKTELWREKRKKRKIETK